MSSSPAAESAEAGGASVRSRIFVMATRDSTPPHAGLHERHKKKLHSRVLLKKEEHPHVHPQHADTCMTHILVP
jgi:hypothetical protein